MRTGISTASLFMRRDTEGALDLFSSWGVPCAEVFLTTFSQYNKEHGEALARHKGEIDVNSVHDLTSQFEPQLFSRHPLVKADAYQMLNGVLSAATEVGAKYYTFHGTTRAKKAARDIAKDNFEKMGEDFAELSAFCVARKITPCLENVEWATYNRPGVFAEVKKRFPPLQGVLDIKQARISRYPYSDYLEEMGESIAYVHLSDIDGNGKMCLPGKGVTDFDELVERLLDVGFDGALLIEAYERDYGEEEELKIAYQFLQEKIYKHKR